MTEEKTVEAIDKGHTEEDKVFLELGPFLLKESLQVGQEYGKLLVPSILALSSFYIAILKLYLGDKMLDLTAPLAFVIYLAPIISYIIALLCAVQLVKPVAEYVGPANADSLRNAFKSMVEKRKKQAEWASLFLAVAVILMAIVLMAIIVWGV